MNKKSTIILMLALMLTLTSSAYATDDPFSIPEDSMEVVSAEDSEKGALEDDSGMDDEEDVSVDDLDALLEKKLEKEDMITPPGVEDELAAEPVDEKLKLKKYKNVRYSKSYAWYSIIPHNTKAFKELLNERGITTEMSKSMFGYARSVTDIVLNALVLDYVYKKPYLAENYYLLFKDNPKFSFYFRKLVLADYLIRTARPRQVKSLIKKSDCMANFKYMSMCNYYLGVADYLVTGNNKNVHLHMAKSRYKKAALIYNKRGFNK